MSKKSRRPSKGRPGSGRAAEKAAKSYELALAAWDARQEVREAAAYATAQEAAQTHPEVAVRLPYTAAVDDWPVGWCRERDYTPPAWPIVSAPSASDPRPPGRSWPASSTSTREPVVETVAAQEALLVGEDMFTLDGIEDLIRETVEETIDETITEVLDEPEGDQVLGSEPDGLFVPTEMLVPRHLFPDERDGHASMTSTWAAVVDTAAGVDDRDDAVMDAYVAALPHKVLDAAETLAGWDMDPAFLHAYVATGYLVTVDNIAFLTREEVDAWQHLVADFRLVYADAYHAEHTLDMDPDLAAQVPSVFTPGFCRALADEFNATMRLLESGKPTPPTAPAAR